MKEEAERRGFIKGVKFYNMHSGVIQTVDRAPYEIFDEIHVIAPKEEWSSLMEGGNSNPCIYENGKWAKLVKPLLDNYTMY